MAGFSFTGLKRVRPREWSWRKRKPSREYGSRPSG
jgi:hypothetical protein